MFGEISAGTSVSRPQGSDSLMDAIVKLGGIEAISTLTRQGRPT